MVEHAYNIQDCTVCNRCDRPVSACRCTAEEIEQEMTPDPIKPICDFFIDYEGTEYVCEVYDTNDGWIDDMALYVLLEDGSKGEAFDSDKLDQTPSIWEQAQSKYESWLALSIDF